MHHRAQRHVWAILFFVIAILAGQSGLRAEGQSKAFPSRALLVVMAYGVTPESLFDSSDARVSEAVGKGAIGLMNTTTPGLRDRADGYASVAFGVRALGGRSAGVTVEVPQAVVDVPLRLRAALHSGMRDVVALNSRDATGYGAVPGVVGDALARAQVRRAVFGTADLGPDLHREAALLVVDSNGRVPEAFLRDAPFADTLRALDAWLLEGSRGHGRSLSVLELGQGSQSQLVGRLGQTLRMVEGLARRDAGPDVLFVSPGPRGGSSRDSLAPMLLLRPSRPTTAKVLASPSTRRTGVVINADVAATVLEMLDVAIPEGVKGRPAFPVTPSSLNGRSPSEWLLSVRASAVAKSSLRTTFATAYVAFLALVLSYILAMYAVKVRTGRVPRRLNWPVAPLLVMWWPLAFLIVAYWAPRSGAAYAGALVLALAPAALAARTLMRSPIGAASALAIAACGAIAADQLSRGALVARAVMSYDIQTGARFYGLGNEYMGVVVGAFILWLGATSELRHLSRQETVGGALIMAITIGAPVLGANTGGLITAVVGFGAAILLLSGRKANPAAIAGLLGLSLCAVVVMSVMDVALGQGQSTHLASAAMQVGSEGLREAIRIVTRKLAMNLRIIAYTPWNLVFLAALGSLIVLTRPGSRLRGWRSMESRHPGLSGALRAALVASVVALLFNDSGVVAGSLAMIYPFYGFAFIVLGEEARREDSGT